MVTETGRRQGHVKCHGEGFGRVVHGPRRCPTSGGRRRWIATVSTAHRLLWTQHSSHLCDEMALPHIRDVLAKMAPLCSEPAAGKSAPVRWGAGGLPRLSHSFGSCCEVGLDVAVEHDSRLCQCAGFCSISLGKARHSGARRPHSIF